VRSSAGVVTRFPITTLNSLPSDIVTGSDGNLWFAEQNVSKIAKMTTAGAITEYSIPTFGTNRGPGQPSDITRGKDSNLWFTMPNVSLVGRITTAGVITQFPTTTANAGPQAITNGPDGNLWFNESNVDKVGSMNTSGAMVSEFNAPAGAGLNGITSSADGNLWVTESTLNQVARVTPAGSFTQFTVPTLAGNPVAITHGPDGFTWFAEGDSAKVAKVETGKPGPSISVSDATVSEGNTGTSTATFTVSLSAASDQTVSISYATANVSATAGTDYVAKALTTLSFAPGVTSQTVGVTVNGDTLHEGNETFNLNLSTPVNAVLADTVGLGTIIDEEGKFSVYAGDVAVTEGNAGTTVASFPVSLSVAPLAGETASVTAATTAGTATAGTDYVTLAPTVVTFSGGQTSKTVAVTVNGDTTVEPNETFTLNLTTPSANTSLGDGSGLGTIVNDDGTPTPPPNPSIYVSDVSILEGGAGTTTANFTVSLSAASAGTVSVQYATANVSATAGSDYVAKALTTLNFAPGVTTQTVGVTVNGDALHEGNETFNLNLSGASGGVLADATGTGTIIDEEGTFSIYVGDAAMSEGDSGTVVLAFPLTLSAAPISGETATVTAATSGGSATAGTDYVTLAATAFTFNVGETSKTVNVTVNGDTATEALETLNLNLTAPSANALRADLSAVGSIVDDD